MNLTSGKKNHLKQQFTPGSKNSIINMGFSVMNFMKVNQGPLSLQKH